MATFISSDRSSYSDDGFLYVYIRNPLFLIFTQSIEAIDVTSVTLSRSNSIHWSMLHWSIGPLVQWLNVKFQMSNDICQMSDVKNQMSIRLNFCWSAPPELLWSFFYHGITFLRRKLNVPSFLVSEKIST